ncbi:hypothetical protein MLD52_06120 [Puniceicoccaceae bacterium K14]|nr:hypothetical protein [Puniceicoccaceae bacterium K14]
MRFKRLSIYATFTFLVFGVFTFSRRSTNVLKTDSHNDSPTKLEIGESSVISKNHHFRWQSLISTWNELSEADQLSGINTILELVSVNDLLELFFQIPQSVSGDISLSLQHELLQAIAIHHPQIVAQITDAIPDQETLDSLRLELDYPQPDFPNSKVLENIDNTFSNIDEERFPQALDFALSLPEGPSKQRALVHLSYHWSNQDLDTALLYAKNLSSENEAFAIALVNHWANHEPKKAMEWARSIADPDKQTKILASLIANWSATSPLQAAQAVANDLPLGEAQEQAIISVASGLAAADPESAILWVEALPPGQLRKYAIQNVAHQLSQANSDNLIAWLETLEASDDRDAALAAGGSQFIEEDPDLALQLFSSIENKSLRHHQTSRALQSWLETDPQTAQTWINERPR